MACGSIPTGGCDNPDLTHSGPCIWDHETPEQHARRVERSKRKAKQQPKDVPERVRELLEENQRLRSELESAIFFRNYVPAEQVAELEARLEAVEELHVAPPGLGPAYCTECGQLDPCDTTKAVQGV